MQGISGKQLSRLQMVQNTAARIITKTRRTMHISPVLKKLHWLPIKARIQFKLLCFAYRSLHNTCPDYLKDLLTPYEPVRQLRSSDSNLLTVPSYRLKSFGFRAFSHIVPVLWNALPSELRLPPTFATFRSQLKTYLFVNNI